VCDEEIDDAEPLFVEEVRLLASMAQRNEYWETVVSESLVEDTNGVLAASWKLVEEEEEVEEGWGGGGGRGVALSRRD
jgi:hypothetical protein